MAFLLTYLAISGRPIFSYQNLIAMSKFNQGNLIPIPDTDKIILDFIKTQPAEKVIDHFRFLMHFFLIEANGTKEFKSELIFTFDSLKQLIDQISLIEKIRNDARINRN